MRVAESICTGKPASVRELTFLRHSSMAIHGISALGLPPSGYGCLNQTRLRQVLALRASILKSLAHRGPARSACSRRTCDKRVAQSAA